MARWEKMAAPYLGLNITADQYRDRETGRTFQCWGSRVNRQVVEVDAEGTRVQNRVLNVPFGTDWLEAVEREFLAEVTR